MAAPYLLMVKYPNFDQVCPSNWIMELIYSVVLIDKFTQVWFDAILFLIQELLMDGTNLTGRLNPKTKSFWWFLLFCLILNLNHDIYNWSFFFIYNWSWYKENVFFLGFSYYIFVFNSYLMVSYIAIIVFLKPINRRI